MILTILREATRSHHQQIEEKMNLSGRLTSRENYCQLLARLYGFYLPVEKKIAFWKTRLEPGLHLETRCKTPLLYQDLCRLGLSAEAIQLLPECRETPPLDDPAQVYGCLYVLEGATLGGQIISRQLKEKFHQDQDSGAAFFNGYGERTGAQWKSFGAALTAFATTPARDALIVESAQKTFESMGHWLTADFEA